MECLSFSRDGRYLACGGCEDKLTLWMVKDIVPELPVRAFIHILRYSQQKIRSQSAAPSCFQVSITVLLNLTVFSQSYHRSTPQIPYYGDFFFQGKLRVPSCKVHPGQY